MRTAIFLILLVAVGGLVGVALKQDPGYVLLNYKTWAVEMPLWVMAIGLVVAFAVFYWTTRLVVYLWNTPERVRRWQEQKRITKARKDTIQGLIELAEGSWKKAEQLLMRSINQDTALLNYLAASKAAQELGAYDRRDDYLRKAHQLDSKASVALGLTQARLQLSHKQLEESLATLMHLRTLAPKHPLVLKLLKDLYCQLGDWDHLHDLMPQLSKYKVISADEKAALERHLYQALIEKYGHEEGHPYLQGVWKKAPQAIHQEAKILASYVQTLLKLGHDKEAETWLREGIKANWNKRLVGLYGELRGENPSQRMATAEAWLSDHPKDGTLLLTLAKLALQKKLWGKARSYLEASISEQPSLEAYQLLGHLLKHLGEEEASVECLQKGLALQLKQSRELPMPELKGSEPDRDAEKQRLLILGA